MDPTDPADIPIPIPRDPKDWLRALVASSVGLLRINSSLVHGSVPGVFEVEIEVEVEVETVLVLVLMGPERGGGRLIVNPEPGLGYNCAPFFPPTVLPGEGGPREAVDNHDPRLVEVVELAVSFLAVGSRWSDVDGGSRDDPDVSGGGSWCGLMVIGSEDDMMGARGR